MPHAFGARRQDNSSDAGFWWVQEGQEGTLRSTEVPDGADERIEGEEKGQKSYKRAGSTGQRWLWVRSVSRLTR